MNIEDRVKLYIGDLIVKMLVANARIEELETKLRDMQDAGPAGIPAERIPE